MPPSGRPRLKDHTGQRFGRWLVIGESDARKRVTQVLWLCQCDCGQYGTVLGNDLRNGKSRGCQSRECRLSKLRELAKRVGPLPTSVLAVGR